MALVNTGRDFIAQAIINDSTPTFFTNANARLGVGNSATAVTATDTDLIGTAARAGMEATYPQRTNNAITFRSSFGNGVAEFAWNEWGIFNAAAAGTMLSRKVESLGTKAAGQTWVLEVTFTITI